ncbi:hypothetical protein L1987_56053 [Smallanthus sonchifolius]|uniref:Uncharacterized protein n=1 Tax=Smallanthus sonchifolius TaxID=185202 RepID=A0ACB9EB98_9ASTR|nr:hypothetical protein L1987_56053 [Smallanthus sonchifolius]
MCCVCLVLLVGPFMLAFKSEEIMSYDMFYVIVSKLLDLFLDCWTQPSPAPHSDYHRRFQSNRTRSPVTRRKPPAPPTPSSGRWSFSRLPCLGQPEITGSPNRTPQQAGFRTLPRKIKGIVNLVKEA